MEVGMKYILSILFIVSLFVTPMLYAEEEFINNGRIKVSGSYEFVNMVVNIYADIQRLPVQAEYLGESCNINWYTIVTPKELREIYGYYKNSEWDIGGGTAGYYDWKYRKRIFVMMDRPYVPTAEVIIHEVSHLRQSYYNRDGTRQSREQVCEIMTIMFYEWYWINTPTYNQ